MATTHEVIILGLGAMGSAAAFHLSRRNIQVLGLERFTPPHIHGSSHGQTRIIREAYFEDPRYVPLIQRAYKLWQELERLSERSLCQLTGGIMVGPGDGALLSGARASARTHGLEYVELDAKTIRERFPALRAPDAMAGLWEPRAGILYPESCIDAHLALARRHGAELRFEETVLDWNVHGGRVQVRTDRGSYEAGRLLMASGGWLPELWPQCPLPLRVERQVMFWFQPRQPELFGLGALPVHVWEHEPRRIFYGFPNLGNGVKVARHDQGEVVDPNRFEREATPPESAAIAQLTERFLPGLGPTMLHHEVCLYTRTPDSHFLIDRHPQFPEVIVASPCSGHGFKFSAVIGEILADMACDRQPPFDLGLFTLRDRGGDFS